VAQTPNRSDLTIREREIAALIARGLANDQIAQELFISKRTVEKHIANIFSKLNLASRAEIVRYMLDSRFAESTAIRD
jgi:DNA-binding NarL/FixJ family response regulator